MKLDEQRDRLRRLAGSSRTWERPLADGITLAGGRICRRRRGPVDRPYLVWFVSGAKRLNDPLGAREFVQGELLGIPPAVAFESVELPDRDREFLALRFDLEPARIHQLARYESAVGAALGRSSYTRGMLKPQLHADAREAVDLCIDYALRAARSDSLARRRFEDVLITLAESAPDALAALAFGHDPLARLQAMLRAAPGEPWTLGQAAAKLAMSPATLKRRLAARELSFSRLLQEIRLEEGRRLLARRDTSVIEAALSVGYASGSKFAAAHRRRYGLPPRRQRSGGA